MAGSKSGRSAPGSGPLSPANFLARIIMIVSESHPISLQRSQSGRQRLRVGLLTCFHLAGATVSLDAGADPVPVGRQKQLFLDDQLVESRRGVYSLVNQPLKYAGNPVLQMDRCWGADMDFGHSNLIYDQEEKIYKMWNQVVDYLWKENLLGYYTSTNGIDWEAPAVGQFDFRSSFCAGRASREHNFVFGKPGGVRAPGVFKDPHEKDPAKRYKMLYRRPALKPGQAGFHAETAKGGVWAAYSPEGIRWTNYPSPEVNPVYMNNDTHQVVFWDEARGRYVAHIRLWPSLFEGDSRFAAREGRVRAPGIATSPDFLKWDAPEGMKDPVAVNRPYLLIPPDERDAPCTGGFYTLECLPYEHQYVAFLTRYHICSGMEPGIPPMRGTARTPWLDTVDIQLVSSRDGRQWHRLGDGRPFLPVGPADTYDAGMVYMAQLPVVRKDLGEIWLYYIGYRKGHWALPRGENEESSINLAKLRLDGFVSLTAGEGEFTTKPLVFEGERLEINARTTGDEGRVTVEVLDASTGAPLAGFGREDCDAFQGNSVAHAVTWRNGPSLKDLAGEPVRLRFHLRRAKIFAFQFQ